AARGREDQSIKRQRFDVREMIADVIRMAAEISLLRVDQKRRGRIEQARNAQKKENGEKRFRPLHSLAIILGKRLCYEPISVVRGNLTMQWAALGPTELSNCQSEDFRRPTLGEAISE